MTTCRVGKRLQGAAGGYASTRSSWFSLSTIASSDAPLLSRLSSWQINAPARPATLGSEIDAVDTVTDPVRTTAFFSETGTPFTVTSTPDGGMTARKSKLSVPALQLACRLLMVKTTLVLVKVAVTVSPELVVPLRLPFRVATATILPPWTLNWVMATLREPLTVTVSPVDRVKEVGLRLALRTVPSDGAATTDGMRAVRARRTMRARGRYARRLII